MNKATMRPRNCWSIWRVRIGDSPMRMPATNAPSTLLTPISCVISAITAMMIRIMVMTGKSLRKLSLVYRITRNTIRRPTVKLASMKSPVPRIARPTDHTSIEPAAARPNATAMMPQPIVSSRMADATMI